MRLQTNRLKNGQYGHVQFETPKGVEEAVKLAGACAPSITEPLFFHRLAHYISCHLIVNRKHYKVQIER